MVLPDGRGRAGDEDHAGRARRRVRLVRDQVARRPDGLLRHRRRGTIYAVDVDGRRDAGRARSPTLDAAWVTALVGAPRRHAAGRHHAGRALYTVDPKSGNVASCYATLPARPRLGAGPRRQDRHALRGHRRRREDLRHRRRAGTSRELWDSGDKHVVSLLAGRRPPPLRRDLRGGDPLPGRPRRARRGAADFDAEEVRALALGSDGRTLYAAVNDFERAAPAIRRAGRGAPGHQDHRGRRRARRPRPARCRGPGSARPRPALYRLEPDGRIEQIFSIGDGYFTRARASTASGRALRRHRDARGASTASPPIARPRWPSTCPSGRR